jgi:hypothetical protein
MTLNPITQLGKQVLDNLGKSRKEVRAGTWDAFRGLKKSAQLAQVFVHMLAR